jgi:hypothetical protein
VNLPNDLVVSKPTLRFLVRQPVGSEHEVDVVPGLRHDMVQCFEMMVSAGAAADLHNIVLGHSPALSEHDQNVIAQALAATRRPRLSFLFDSSPGRVSAKSSATRDSHAAACALAVVCASAGLDGSQTISVSVDERSWQVALGFDGKYWRCRVA